MQKIKYFTMSILICSIFFSCVSGKKQMNQAMNNVYTGMSIKEFNKLFPKKELVSLKQGTTIYKVTKQVWYDSDGSGSGFRYFYFHNKKLGQVDKGQRAVDRRIKVETN